jgi:hypothetical protein
MDILLNERNREPIKDDSLPNEIRRKSFARAKQVLSG